MTGCRASSFPVPPIRVAAHLKDLLGLRLGARLGRLVPGAVDKESTKPNSDRARGNIKAVIKNPSLD